MENVKGILAFDRKSFKEPSHKMLDQNKMKYFVCFEDIFSFCILAIYELTPLTSVDLLPLCY